MIIASNEHDTELTNSFTSNTSGRKPGDTQSLTQILNLPTSAKPVMTKLQTLLIEIVDTDIFQMTLEFTLLTVD